MLNEISTLQGFSLIYLMKMFSNDVGNRSPNEMVIQLLNENTLHQIL